jgi:CheY-like chemotaxis protein
MALRVLLADESTSIKKVMQLALQDFGVEVKSVPIGIDVVPVAKSWTPDIVFADVLLAKKSGYDVSLELKNDPTLKEIPVVLMWSGFMDIDEARATASKANRRLEKPFDADTLRGLVKDLVPNTSSNSISDFLAFPKLPEFIENTPPFPETLPATSVLSEDLEKQSRNPFEVEEPEDFAQVPLPKTLDKMDLEVTSLSSANALPDDFILQPEAPEAGAGTGWSSGNLDRFKIQIPNDDITPEDLEDEHEHSKSFSIELAGGGEISVEELSPPTGSRNLETFSSEKTVKKAPSTPKPSNEQRASASSQSMPAMDPAAMEELLREQARLILTDLAWKMMPDMVERILKEELQKLLKEAEKLS